MKQKQTLIVRGYSLTPEVYAIIREVSFERRLENTSEALRQIVLEWHKLTGGERAKANEPSIDPDGVTGTLIRTLPID